MRVIALIPARLGATRFPSKLLATIKGKSVIRRTYESAVRTGLFDEVIVVLIVMISFMKYLFMVVLL